MASQIHFENGFPAGTFKTSPDFTEKSKVVLYEAGNDLYLHVGPDKSPFDDLAMIAIGVEGAKELLDSLRGALVQMGELPTK